MKRIDFLAIGDIVVDDFIRISDAHEHKIDTNYPELCFRFGDKVPFLFHEIVPAVGNSPNASVCASRLRLKSALVTALGDDKNGKDCIVVLKKDKVDTSYIKINKNIPTNYHYVLWHGPERTILTKHADFNYSSLAKIPPAKWVYLSSLGPHALPFHKEIESYLKKNKETKLAFQPGTYQISLGYKKLKYFYERADIFFCNREEAMRILKTMNKDIKFLLKAVKKLGPKIAVISDGVKGAYAYDGKSGWHIPMYPDPKPPYDRTGAGDSFSATFTIAIALGKTIPEALSWGPVNSMSVVQYVGAQKGLLSRNKLLAYLKKAPTSYIIKKII